MPNNVINITTIGTQTIVVHVTEWAVDLLSIPYGSKNILVLVIGRTELMIITANHALVIRPKLNRGKKKSAVSNGVINTVKINILLTQDQWSPGLLVLSTPTNFLSSEILRSVGWIPAPT